MSHIFDEVPKNKNRKMNPLFFLSKNPKRKQAENKQNKNPLHQFSKIRLHIFLIRQQKFSASKKLADIFIFFFWVFLFSVNGDQPGAAPEGREADFFVMGIFEE